jgi:hypothetical protein
VEGIPAVEEPAARDEEDEAFDREWVRTSVAGVLARQQAQSARYGEVVARMIAASERGNPATLKALGVTRDLVQRSRRGLQRHFADVLRTTVLLDARVGETWSMIQRWLP